MLLQALYDYAHERKLLETLPFEDRMIHAIVPLDLDGSLRLQHLIPQSTPDAKGKERPGRRLSLPSYPGEPNGGKAYFLAESAIAVFGRDKLSGEPIWSDPVKAPKSDRNDPKLFRDFWRQIEIAHEATNDSRLAAMLKFRDRYLTERESKIAGEFSFLVTRSKEKAKTADQVEFVAKTGTEKNQFVPTKDAVFAFSVDGSFVTFGDDQDTLREYWKSQFYRDFSARNDEATDDEDEDTDEDAGCPTSLDSVCLITGAIGQPIARSHNPKIRGVPFLTQKGVQRSNGRIVSFNRERPAFSSYGLSQGANAPVSQDAAASYALALNAILRDENARFDAGPLAFCIWSKETPQIGRQFKRLLENGFPEHVQDVFGSLYSGIEREKVRNTERLHTVAITCATKARVAIKYWLDLPLAEAESKFAKWWDELRIVSLLPIPATKESSARNLKGEPRESPYGLRQLAMTTVRQSKDHKDDKLVAERVVQLYRAALEGTAPSLMLLKPILDEFQSALLKNDPRIDPFNPSRFALIKLILIRNHSLPELSEGKEGDFMQLVADTTDDAYNCGRLLAVMEALQNRSRKTGKNQQERKTTDRPNAGVIARYYGRASTAPATVFAMLLGLSHHHESKLQRGNEADKKAAGGFERRKIEILSRLRPDANVPNSPPNFPKLLKLIEQGRFALGFYHQKAHDREELRKYRATLGKEGDDLADSDDADEET